ncbi:transposase [Citrobacter sp. NCU1]|uniref:transposase n=1 Tax=Citrobacter sp. NCU1 TaxID=2026683 RepID=UPI001391428C|nr:transposase [Citrobacter sp. NCU1]NDO83756.1 transposase [Citrobacter sp. NCU1]
MNIVRNTVWRIDNFEDMTEGLYRVLEFNVDLDVVILFELQNKRMSKPFVFSFKKFSLMVKAREVISAEYANPPYMFIDESKINESSRAKRDENFQLIYPLISNSQFLIEYAMFPRSTTVKKYAKENNTDHQKIRMLLTKYWRYGQDLYALLPAYPNSGGAGKQRKSGGISLGKTKVNRVLPMERNQPFILSDTDKTNMVKSIKKHHLKVGGLSLEKTYGKYIKRYFRHELERADKAGIPPYIPSKRQFRYWKLKLISRNDDITSKSTKTQYLLTQRALLGSAANKETLPGDVFEIDATVADVHLISSLNMSKVIGRPTIYTVMDRATRMIVGMHISLYHASWRAARQALANCFMPKKEYCRQFGVKITEREWPCSHIPLKLMCDNGEMIGLKPQDVVTPMTALEFAPSNRGDRKSIVESRFHILNQEAIHPLLGTTRGGKIVRGEPNPTSRACLTLTEVTKTLILAVLEHNQSIFEEVAYINPLLIAHDLKMSPLNSWNISLKFGRFSARKSTEDEVISRLLPPENVSITPRGIQYNNLYYDCDEGLASSARVFGHIPCEVRIDENCADYIYVRLDKNSVFTKHFLLEKRNIFYGRPHMEADVLADWIDLQKELSPVTMNSFVVDEHLEALNKKGRLRLDELKPHNNKRTKGIRQNRKEEIDALNGTAEQEKKKEFTLPPVENVVLLPGREAKEKWLATKKNTYDPEG